VPHDAPKKFPVSEGNISKNTYGIVQESELRLRLMARILLVLPYNFSIIGNLAGLLLSSKWDKGDKN
jgi:hypothetical protein